MFLLPPAGAGLIFQSFVVISYAFFYHFFNLTASSNLVNEQVRPRGWVGGWGGGGGGRAGGNFLYMA